MGRVMKLRGVRSKVLSILGLGLTLAAAGAVIPAGPCRAASAGTEVHAAAKRTAHTKAPSAAVLKEASKVADWQLSHMDNFDYIPAGQHRTSTEGRRDWIQAAFYIWLIQLADATG